MNFPLLKKFTVNEEITEFLLKKNKEYIEQNPIPLQEPTGFSNDKKNSGYQSSNLLLWEDKEFQFFIREKLYDFICKNLGIPGIRYYWVHILEYENGGSMDIHDHKHNEDFVFFIYLSSCQTGDTIFYLNDESMKRTSVRIKPEKGMGACFSSLLPHKGEYTEENKKIFVVGLRVQQ